MKLELWHPIYPYITQRFGDNNVCAKGGHYIGATNGVCPTGYVKFYSDVLGHKGHNGIDYQAMRGEQIYAAHEGTVIELGTGTTKGLEVHLITDKPYEFSGGNYLAKTIYLHLMGVNVKVGDKVKIGDCIGWADNTGASTGNHLHWGLAPCDSTGTKLFPDNGYGGYVDPLAYTQNKEAKNAGPLLKQLQETIARLAEAIADLLRKRSNN